MRLAPAAIMASAASLERIPPEAFTPSSSPTTPRMRATSSTVAPPVEKPVEVFTKSAPAFLAHRQAFTFCSSFKRQVSMMTFNRALPRMASATVLISFSTYSQSPSRAAPTEMTMSISWAPFSTHSFASAALMAEGVAPSGKPTTQQVLISVPSSSLATKEAKMGLTQTLAVL